MVRSFVRFSFDFKAAIVIFGVFGVEDGDFLPDASSGGAPVGLGVESCLNAVHAAGRLLFSGGALASALGDCALREVLFCGLELLEELDVVRVPFPRDRIGRVVSEIFKRRVADDAARL